MEQKPETKLTKIDWTKPIGPTPAWKSISDVKYIGKYNDMNVVAFSRRTPVSQVKSIAPMLVDDHGCVLSPFRDHAIQNIPPVLWFNVYYNKKYCTIELGSSRAFVSKDDAIKVAGTVKVDGMVHIGAFSFEKPE